MRLRCGTEVPPLKTARRPAGRAGGEARGGQRGPLWFLFIYGSLSVRKKANPHPSPSPVRACVSTVRTVHRWQARIFRAVSAPFYLCSLSRRSPHQGAWRTGAGRARRATIPARLITRVLSGSRVLAVDASDWPGERIEHSLSDLSVSALSGPPSFYGFFLSMVLYSGRVLATEGRACRAHRRVCGGLLAACTPVSEWSSRGRRRWRRVRRGRGR